MAASRIDRIGGVDSPQSLLSLVERFRRDLALLDVPGGARAILVAASGGPDSTALARLFAAVRDVPEGGGASGGSRAQAGNPNRPLPPIWLGHVHHGIRGADADGDLEAVQALAASLGFGFLEARVDVPALARERGLSLEAGAREARYDAFEGWADRHGIDIVALGHTADDQAETVLLRILRRSGLRGLGGMPAARPLRRGQPGRFPRIVRPLLAWRRTGILDLLGLLGQGWREDRSNLDLSILRNRIRHRLLPLLRARFDPAADAALLDVARFAAAAARDLEALAREALQAAVISRSPDRIVLRGGALTALKPTVRALAIEIEACEIGGDGGGGPKAPATRPSRRRIERVAARFDASSASGPVGKGWWMMDLGAGTLAEQRRGDLILLRQAEPESPPGPVALPVPGTARWRSWEIRAEAAPPGTAIPPEGFPPGLAEVVDGAALPGLLEVRSRRRGERFHPLGAAGPKKLKEFLRERGVAPRDRDGIPLVAGPGGILWVVGHRIAHPVRTGPGTSGRILLSARRIGMP